MALQKVCEIEQKEYLGTPIEKMTHFRIHITAGLIKRPSFLRS